MHTYTHEGSSTQNYQQHAKEIVLCELIDALFLENICGLASRGSICTEAPHPALATLDGEMVFQVSLTEQQALCWRVRPGILQSYRLSRLPVVLLTSGIEETQVRLLEPATVLHLLIHALPMEERMRLPGSERFARELDLAVSQTALALPHWKPYTPDAHSFLALEQRAAQRDRPFHPTARAKWHWDQDAYCRYGTASGNTFGVNWLAVRRDYLRTGAGATIHGIAPHIISSEERSLLEDAMIQAACSPDDYLPLPVHPWQMQHILPGMFANELQQGICVPLKPVRAYQPVDFTLGLFQATSSVRTLMPLSDALPHLKLPLGISALGALRTLPLRYMENGQKGQGLLQALISRDPVLQGRLLYCREDEWWAFQDPQGDPFTQRYGHLACQLRRYPHEVFHADTLVVPMAALAIPDPDGQHTVFSHLLLARGADPTDAAAALALFREICELFMLVTLSCARYGILPEMHGQNVLLLYRQGKVTQLLLRDHDTIRVYLPWLHEAALPDPEYTVKPHTRNTLLLPTPEALLSYFQTLGIQVNLYAIARALEEAYGIDEAIGWHCIDASIRQTLMDINCTATIGDVFIQTLLRSTTWPTKLVLLPLLQRSDAEDEGMPSAQDVIANPLHRMNMSNARMGGMHG